MEASRKSRKLKTRRRKHSLKNYFKYPIGVTSGTTHYDFSAQESLCACLVGFCYSFLLPEGSWTPNFINEMLLSVAEHDQEVDINPSGDLSPLTRTFHLDRYSLDLFLQEISSGGMNQERDTLYEDLQRCFKSRKSLLIVTGEECVVIWTKDDHFGFFTFIPNKKNLLLVANLKDLVTSLRFLYASDTSYRICEVKITRLQQGSGGEEAPQLPGRGFVIIDEDLAILRGNLQLKRSPEEIRGLFTGYAAAIFAHRIPLNSWDSDILDRVLLISETLSRKPLRDDGRKTFYIVSCGAFRSHLDVEIVFYAEFMEILEDVHRIENFLALGYCLVMEYQGCYWTIMQQNLFYLLDPYESLGSASSLQMHHSLHGVLAVLANLAEESTQVNIHIIRIVSVEEKGPNSPEDEPLSAKSVQLGALDAMEEQRKIAEEEEQKKRQMEELVRNMKLKRKQIQSKLKEVEVQEKIHEAEALEAIPEETTLYLEGDQMKTSEEKMQMEELMKSLKEEDFLSSSEGSNFGETPQNTPNFHLSDLEQSEAGTSHFSEGTEINTAKSHAPSTYETYEIKKEPTPSRDTSPDTMKDDLILLQSVSGSGTSLNKLLRKGLSLSSRLLITTPRKHFLVLHRNRNLYLYLGCVCKIPLLPKEITKEENFQRFRTISSLIQHLLDINKS